MMLRFFSVSDNSLYTSLFPWIDKIIEGLTDGHKCSKCGSIVRYPHDDIIVSLEPSKGTAWPDVLGCGSFPLFIVSENVIEAWRREGIGEYPLHRVSISRPLPEQLQTTKTPAYFWIDGKKLKGAAIEFESSGFVDVRFCEVCGTRTDDIISTYKRQHSEIWPYVFRQGSWNGDNLFTTDLSPTAFFCTEALVKCATKYRHTNFRFIPTEQGAAAHSKGVRYLGNSQKITSQ